MFTVHRPEGVLGVEADDASNALARLILSLKEVDQTVEGVADAEEEDLAGMGSPVGLVSTLYLGWVPSSSSIDLARRISPRDRSKARSPTWCYAG